MSLSSRLACADSSFPRLSHDGALAVIRDLGIGAVDLCVFEGYQHTSPRQVIDDPAAVAEAVLARLHRHQLVVADVFAILADDFETLAVNHPDPAVREDSLRRFRKMVELGARLGAPGLTVLPGVPFAGVGDEDGRSLAAAELERRAALAGEAGLRLTFEPHYRSIAATPASALRLLEQAPSVGLTLDYSHFLFQGIRQADVDPLIPHARHVHLRQAAPGVMQARAREGAIDFPALGDKLEASGYEGYLAIEYQCEEWLECRRVDCVSETAEMRDLMLENHSIEKTERGGF